MTPEAQEKLDLILLLIEKRDRIINELATLLVGTPSNEETDVAGDKLGKPKKRKCGNCGKPGHIARNCGGKQAKVAADPDADEKHLTRTQFELAHEMAENDSTTSTIAEELSSKSNLITFEMVNKALNFLEDEYELYLKSFTL